MSQSSITSTSKISTVFGTWRTRSPLDDHDLEAQVIVGTRVPLYTILPSPALALAHSSRTESAHMQNEGTDPIDDFFGVTSPRRGTRDSRHDTPSLATHVEALPPYEESDLPAYTPAASRATLAEYLFKYGFLFPLFWIIGALILLSPLTASDDWESGKSEEERLQLLTEMRRSEVKWAKRSFVALVVLTLVAVIIILTAVFVMRS